MHKSLATLVIALASFAMANTALSETITIQDAQLLLVDDVLVSTQESGIVKHTLVEPNDIVKLDDLLVELDKDIQFAQVAGAQKQLAIAREESTNDINLRYARKSAQVAAKELERAQSAAAKYARAVSQTELEKLDLQLQQAQLSGEQAQHELTVNRLQTELKSTELELAEIKLRQRKINSPIAGQVAEVLVQEGEWVELGAPVARVVNLEKLRVVALVPEAFLFSLSKGQRADLTIDIGSDSNDEADASVNKKALKARGEVSFVSPEINPVNREFVIWVDIDNSNKKLRPGLVGTLQIDAKPTDATLVNGE